MSQTKVPRDMLGPDAQAVSPLIAKGQIYGHDGTGASLIPAGVDGQVLTARAAAPDGAQFENLPGFATVGDFKLSAQAADHSGWLLCDGREFNNNTHAALAALLGTTWGGTPAVSFRVPNAKGRIPIVTGAGVGPVPVSAINAGTNEMTVAANQLIYTGTPVIYTSDQSAAGGLVSGQGYWAIKVSETAVKLASSRANANAGTAIDITSAGSGVHALAVAHEDAGGTIVAGLTTRTAGQIGGEEAHTQTAAELVPHVHAATVTGAPLTVGGGPTAAQAGNTGSTGGGAATPNMPPWIALGNLFVYAG